jgi:hypothetical protein
MGTPSRLESGESPKGLVGSTPSPSAVSSREGMPFGLASRFEICRGATPQEGSIPPPSAIRGTPNGRAVDCKSTALRRMQVRILPHGPPSPAAQGASPATATPFAEKTWPSARRARARSTSRDAPGASGEALFLNIARLELEPPLRDEVQRELAPGSKPDAFRPERACGCAQVCIHPLE